MKKDINIVIIAFLCSAFICCHSTKEEEPKVATEESVSETVIQLTDEQMKIGGIELGSITDQSINETIQLSGMVDVPPQNMVSVSFPMGGYLKSTKLLPGMHVAKGETIATIEDQSIVQLQQDYLMARTRLNLARLDYDRQKSLNETKTASDKTYQQAISEYESTNVLVLGLAEKLRLININPENLNAHSISRRVSIPSPINGFVSKVNVNIGKYVQPQDVSFELIDPSDIHAALTVFEKDINKIQQGQKVQLYFVDEPEKTYEAEVILITKNVDENRSGIIHCHFETMPPNLKPGMFITAKISLSVSLVKALPEDAVVRFENAEYVFVQKTKNEFEAVEIKTGKRTNGWVELVSPDAALLSKQVVLKNAFTVLSKWKNVGEDE
jgi:membrane fusion protein, heavy metal efflux system